MLYNTLQVHVQALLFSLQKTLAERMDLRQHSFPYAPQMHCT